MEAKKYQILVKKKTNKLVTKWIMPIFFIGTFIALIKLVFGTNFLPDISFCASYPNIFCKLPIIRLPLGMLSLKFAVFIVLWASIVLPAYFIFDRLGFKESNREYKETKADKIKWNRYGIYAAIIFLPLYVLFLIFFAD